MIRLFLLYAVSGFVSLGYQVAWFRIFTDWFGSTNLTFALVVCCFIGGLGFGALWSKPVANWIGRTHHLDSRMRLYGVI
jgi:predicted membrane-bound spermidine synthase